MNPLGVEQAKSQAQLRRYAWLLAAFWTATVAASLVWSIRRENVESHEIALASARIAFQKDVVYRRWSAGHGGLYARITEETPPNPYLAHLPERDITTPSGRKLTLINPAYMTRQVHELEEELHGIKGHITSLKPLRPENAPDAWEAEALKAIERGASEVSSVEELDGQPYMRLTRPLYTEQVCLKCHGQQGYKLGDLRGGMSVSVPMAPSQTIAGSHVLALYFGHGGLWLVGLVGVAVGMRHARRHVRQRDLAEEALRAQTHALDERLKELSCMYGVAEATQTRDALEVVFRDIAALIPLGWQYPEITRAKVCFDGQEYVSEPFEETAWRLSSDLVIGGERCGVAQVYYTEERRELDEGPFLLEERQLLDGIARTLSEAVERKRAEQQLWEAKRRAEEAHAELQKAHAEIRQLFEAFSSLLIGVDQDGRVTSWNGAAERTFGVDNENAVGQLLVDLRMEWDHATVASRIAECRAENRLVRIDEMRFKRPDGTEGFLGITLNPVGADGGRGVGILLVAADITEQKILQGQLVQAQKLESIGQLAAGIAHEINTPTQYVGDNTRFLQDSVQDLIKIADRYAGLSDPGRRQQSWNERSAEIKAVLDELDIEFLKEEIPNAIEQSLEGVERVAKIVRAMKDFSHPGAEGKEAVDLNKAIESTTTVARNEWKYVAEMVVDFDPALPSVPCLAGEFNQVILNIVINAAHAIADVVGKNTGKKGTITITTRQDGEWAEIRISDTGTGIPEDHRTKVFDHFFTTKEVGKGTGQGLAIAHAVIAEKHGGSITLESEMGRGTTFIIRLPIEPESPTAEEKRHEEAHSLR